MVLRTSLLARSIKRIADMCEQASPRPAMQSQCAHMITPVFSAATQAVTGEVDSLCECFILAVITRATRRHEVRVKWSFCLCVCVCVCVFA